MAGVTVTYGEADTYGEFTRQHGVITFDSSYPAGGETVGAEWDAYGAHALTVLIDPMSTNATYSAIYDKATDTAYCQTRADGLEVADTTDISAFIVPFWILKKKN